MSGGFILYFPNHSHCSTHILPLQLGVMAYHIENNDSQLMGIKKREYLRVLANIVNESRQEQVQCVPRCKRLHDKPNQAFFASSCSHV